MIQFGFYIYHPKLIPCLQEQVSQHVASWHMCLSFYTGDMRVAMQVAYLSYHKCVTDTCKSWISVNRNVKQKPEGLVWNGMFETDECKLSFYIHIVLDELFPTPTYNELI
jgi:hypothetical protein